MKRIMFYIYKTLRLNPCALDPLSGSIDDDSLNSLDELESWGLIIHSQIARIPPSMIESITNAPLSWIISRLYIIY